MKIIKRSSFYLVLLLLFFIIVFPFYWEVVTSLKRPVEIFSSFKLYAAQPSFSSYSDVFSQRPFARYILNSFVISCSTTLIAVTLAIFASYAIARYSFKGKKFLLGLVLSISMIPQIAVITPIYIFIRDIGLKNTYFGLIIPYITFELPLSVWYLSTFFKQIPFQLEEAALMDGANTIQILYKILAPLAAPGIFTSAILIFISAWNEYMFALTINTEDNMRTVPVGITMYQGQYMIPWGEIAAAIVVVTIPLIIMVLIFQRKIISGLTAGGVKG